MADLIRYDLLAQDALRGVVRKVLSDVAKGGLPGDHHFFIEFNFDAPGVKISDRLRQSQLKKSPDAHSMTIVLQHQFWDLSVNERNFEIGLSFGGVAEKLVVPFDAIKGFFDPSVQFGLQFETVTEVQAPHGVAANEAGDSATAGDRRPSPRGAASEPEEIPKSHTSVPSSRAKKKDAAEPAPKKSVKEAGENAGGAEVVSLDKFRKK